MRILIVEDDARVAEVVDRALRSSGHLVEVARTRSSAVARLQDARFELAIVDVGLPDGSGLDVCRAARKDGLDLPILLLTAHNGVTDRVAGLDAGADDYLGKPFSVAELNARVRALGRRGPRWTESVRHYAALTIDRDRRTVTTGGERVMLTPREFDIVAMLAWRDGRVVPRDELLEVVWGEASTKNGSSLDVLVTRIRRKLGDVIRTARQVGYAWALDRSKRG